MVELRRMWWRMNEEYSAWVVEIDEKHNERLKREQVRETDNDIVLYRH